MTETEQLFLRIMTDYLHQRETTVPENTDWKRLSHLAKEHQVGGLIYVQCKPWIDRTPALAQETALLKKEFGLAAKHYINNQIELETVRAALTEKGIPFLPVKGPLVAQYYPDPALRTMGDIDFVIHHSDRQAICDVMQELGYENSVLADKELHFTLRSTVFEMQEELIHDHGEDNAALYQYFSGLWEHASPLSESSEYRLDPNFHFLYLVAHIAKHMKWVGVGFRQFFDLAVLLRYYPEGFDWDWMQREAEACGLLSFLQNCLTLCARWFDVPTPISASAISDQTVETITSKIFQDGVFGFHNEENRIHKLEYYKSRSSQPLFLIKLKTLRTLVFPSYKSLIVSEKYKQLRGKPWLLPAVWIKRLYHAGHQQDHIDAAHTLLTATESDVTARQQILRDIGL